MNCQRCGQPFDLAAIVTSRAQITVCEVCSDIPTYEEWEPSYKVVEEGYYDAVRSPTNRKGALKIALVAFILATSLMGATEPTTPCKTQLKAAQTVITACGNLVTAQQESIANLKKDVSTLEQRLADSQESPIVPEWLLVTLGIAGGLALGLVIH